MLSPTVVPANYAVFIRLLTEIIQQRRKAADVNTYVMANVLEITQSHYERLETGNDTAAWPLLRLYTIAALLRTPLVTFITDAEALLDAANALYAAAPSVPADADDSQGAEEGSAPAHNEVKQQLRQGLRDLVAARLARGGVVALPSIADVRQGGPRD